MTAYRFCRSDDVPLIVDAFHRCNVGPGAVPWRLTVDHMKRLSREVDLWTSSCMVAFAGDDPIGVLIAAKREPEANLLLHVAVHPDHRRQGHGRHMMTSLSQKMAILEPTLMLAEVRAQAGAPAAFLQACGFVAGDTLIDHLYPGARPSSGPSPGLGGRLVPGGPDSPGAAIPATGSRSGPRSTPGGLANLIGRVDPEEITASAAFAAASERGSCWQRSVRTIRNLRQRAQGIGIATDRGFEAWLLYRDPGDAADPLPFLARPPADPARLDQGDHRAPGQASFSAPCEILAIGGQRPLPALVGPLLTFVAAETGRALYLPRVHPGEPLGDRLDDLGFQAAGKTVRYESDAARS